MKKIFKILPVILVFTISCSKSFLDNPPLGSQTVDTFYQNEKEAEQSLMAAYYFLSPDDWWQMDYFRLVGDVCSDDAFKGNSIPSDQRDFGNLATFNITPQNEWLDNYWTFLYRGIYNANLVISRVPNSPFDNDDLKKQLVAEAKVLRAFQYFELVKNWGGVILMTDEPTVQDQTKARSTTVEVYNQMIKDLTEAAVDLPTVVNQASDQRGRITQGAALGLLAKVYLYKGDFANAKITAEQIITQGYYSLESQFKDVWSVHNRNGKESLFEIQSSSDMAFDLGTSFSTLTRSRADGGWGFATPSSHLEEFLKNDPRRPYTILKHGDMINQDGNHDPNGYSYNAQL
jgi:hypothetical protein